MKNNKMIKCFSTLLVISLLACGCGKEIEVKNGSKVAVSTKESKITATEYYDSIKKENISKLVDMIDQDLFKEKYKSNDEENAKVKEQIDSIKSYYGSDPTTYEAALRQFFGVNTEDELEELIRLEYKRSQAVADYIMDNLKDDEIEKYYKEEVFGQVKASHILIPVETTDSATEDEKAAAEKVAKEEAEKIIKQLKDGKKFATLAKKYSKDEGTASNGGDLGYFNLDEMVEEFSNAVKELKVDEYTKEPVKSQFGYHIIIKTGEKEKEALKNVKNDIKEKLKDRKLNNDSTLYYTTLKEIREANKIKWNDDVLKKAYNDYMEEIIEAAKEQATQQ
mgnify:CR=1 FL=1